MKELPKFRLLAEPVPEVPTAFTLTKDNEQALRAFLRKIPELKGEPGEAIKGDGGDAGKEGRRGRRGERGLPPDYFVNKLPDGYELRFSDPESEPIAIKHGAKGEIGPMPAHEVGVRQFRMQRPNGSWGPWIRQLPGPKGDKGEKGDKGDAGLPPDHEFKGSRLRFRNPNGAWGEFVDLRGPTGAGGGGRGRSANPGYSSIVLNGTDLEFRRAKAGPLGPDTVVDLSPLGGANPWLEFVAQSANPGTVPANTLYLDDGTNFIANSLIWGDLTRPTVIGPNFSVGNPGTEQGGINVNGTIYDAVQKINSVGGALDASLILHRHSTSFPANLTFARTNDDTTGHTAVVLGQTLGSLIYTGWTGTHYDIGAVIDARVSPVGTIGVGSIPTELAFFTTPDGADAAALGMILGSDQVLYGSNVSQGELILRGTQNANLGFIRMSAPVVFDSYSANPTAAYGFSYTATENFTGAFIGGGLNFSGTISFLGGTFIYESFRGAPTVTTNGNPGFAAYTVLQALPRFIAGSGGGHNPLPPLILNCGPTVENPFSGSRTTSSIQGVNFAAQLNPSVSGAVMNVTNVIGLTFAPVWNTVAGSRAEFGTMRAVFAKNPTQALFASSAGIERGTAYYALDVENITLNNQFGTMPRAAVRSLMTAGNNKFFLLNGGGALSDFGNGDISFNDAGGIILGTSNDVRLEWDGPNNAWNWSPLIGEDLGIAFGVVSGKPTYLFEAENFGVSETNYTQIRFGFDRYAFGQAGTIGNQVGVFVAGNRTVEVAGGWSDYLLTQAGSLNIGTFAMSDVAAWTINQISLDNTAGSISTLDTLVVGGMTTSNPGITVTERSALRVQGRFKQSGSIQYPPVVPAALGAGDNDDWAGLLTGSPNNNGRYWARVSGNVTTSVITGIDATAVQDGDTFEITNVSANTILLADQNAGSVAANRIITGVVGSYSLAQDKTATVRYDATSARWRITTPAGAVLPLASTWKFDTTVTMADPGSTFFRLNNATLASVTAIAISDVTFKEGDASAILAALGAGDQMYLQNSRDAAQRMVFDITSVTDNTTWFQINGTVNASGSAFTGNQEFTVVAIFA